MEWVEFTLVACQKAANRLRTQLIAQFGHSHGGTFAFQSVYGKDDQRIPIAGVATLATPFIDTRQRLIPLFSKRFLLTWPFYLLIHF